MIYKMFLLLLSQLFCQKKAVIVFNNKELSFDQDKSGAYWYISSKIVDDVRSLPSYFLESFSSFERFFWLTNEGKIAPPRFVIPWTNPKPQNTSFCLFPVAFRGKNALKTFLKEMEIRYRPKIAPNHLSK